MSTVGVPLTLALLSGLFAVVGVYGSIAISNDDTHSALTVAILVLMTVGANVPLGPQPDGVTIGSIIFVVDGALIILGAISLRSWRRQEIGREHIFFLFYVTWVTVLIVAAPGPRSDVMVWYSVHVARYVAAFIVIARSVSSGWIEASKALGVVILTILGHAIVATFQAITGPIEGLTVLGFNTRVVATFGPLPTGPYIGGFTGGSAFASLVIIAIPVVFSYIFSDRVPRIFSLVGTVWLAFILQLTAWDAARGALLVSLYTCLAVFGWWYTDVIWSRGDAISDVWNQSRLRIQLISVISLIITAATVWQYTRFNSNVEYDPVFLDPELGQATIQSINIPGFSTENLGIRIHQYVGGIDIFLQYPLTGLGGANYNYIALAYADKQNMIHNMYIGVLAETGIVGAILLFGGIMIVLLRVWTIAKTEDSPVWLGLLVGLIGFFSLQLLQPQYLRPVTMTSVFGILGIITGKYLRDNPPDDDIWADAWTHSQLISAINHSTSLKIIESIPERLSEMTESVRPRFQRQFASAVRWLMD
ncbi:O-antigen ligase family protein [Halorubrum tropicale]|uniref:O-antigen ligase family protein n=1 Tax=Halorubrum tropicale TaxID=1765655 RepID=UPI001431D9A9|nr:O-antigen ligase family protein [Halorubrum tropicale]